MTTIELINIVAKKAGIRELEAKFFFELFIKRLSDRMKPGESVKFNDVGYFHLRTVKKNAESKEDNKTSSDKVKNYVILFSKQSEQMDDLENNIIFNVHDIPEGEQDEIDSYFSLSVGKPLIPVEGVTDGEQFKMQTGIELRETLLNKAEQLVGIAEKLEGVIGNEEITLEKSEFSKRKKEFLESEPLPDETPITGEDTFPNPDNIRDSITNYDEYISGKIENEISHETEEGVKPETDMDESSSEKLPWNFGRDVFDKKVDYKSEKSEDIAAEKDEEEPVEEIETGKPSDELIEAKEDEPEASSISDEEIDKDSTDFGIEQEEVQTEKEIEQDEKLKSIIDDYITKNEPEKFGAFERVKSYVSNVKKDKTEQEEIIEETDEPELAEIEEETTDDGFLEVQSKSTEYHLDNDKAKIKKEKETASSKKSSREDRYLYKKTKRSIVPFLVAFFAIVFVVAIVYLYMESDSIFKSEEIEEDILPIVRPTSVTVIEREYIFPVTYPYSVSETGEEIPGINLALFSDEEIVFKPPVPKQVIDEKEEETTVTKEDEQSSSEESIGLVSKNIYKYKDYYVVQVAAFKSYSVAKEEAKKYEEMGYNTFVEIAEITDQGTWFRLRVGDFTTREKANSFASKYIK